MTSGAGTSVSSPMLRAICRITRGRSVPARACSSGAVTDHAPLAAAERNVHDGALPGHPHREGTDGVDRFLRMEADPLLGGPRASLCCTRKPLKTWTCPSSMRTRSGTGIHAARLAANRACLYRDRANPTLSNCRCAISNALKPCVAMRYAPGRCRRKLSNLLCQNAAASQIVRHR